jgi:hypothetical protein
MWVEMSKQHTEIRLDTYSLEKVTRTVYNSEWTDIYKYKFNLTLLNFEDDKKPLWACGRETSFGSFSLPGDTHTLCAGPSVLASMLPTFRSLWQHTVTQLFDTYIYFSLPNCSTKVAWYQTASVEDDSITASTVRRRGQSHKVFPIRGHMDCSQIQGNKALKLSLIVPFRMWQKPNRARRRLRMRISSQSNIPLIPWIIFTKYNRQRRNISWCAVQNKYHYAFVVPGQSTLQMRQ